MFGSALSAQFPTWQVRGDTAGVPLGCAATAIGALDLFFRAMASADSETLARIVAPGFSFSTGNWTPTDPLR